MVGTVYLDASATRPAVVIWHTVMQNTTTQNTTRWLSIAHNTVKQLPRLARILTT
jgi:hypothetical protein